MAALDDAGEPSDVSRSAALEKEPAMSFFRRMARGRSEATPARTLTSVGAVIVVGVALVVILVYAIQSAL